MDSSKARPAIITKGQTLGLNEDRNGPAIEINECDGKPVGLPPGNLPGRYRIVEFCWFVETALEHEPADDQALLPTDGDSTSRGLERYHVEIDIARGAG